MPVHAYFIIYNPAMIQDIFHDNIVCKNAGGKCSITVTGTQNI